VEVGLKSQSESLSIRMPCGMHFGVKRHHWIFLGLDKVFKVGCLLTKQMTI
jgi:hypothetical protein